MAPAYEVNARVAADAEAQGAALLAMVRWGIAAGAAPDDEARVAALAAARRDAELALHQAVHLATARRRPTPWRALAAAAGMPLQTFHRRYRGRPAVIPPARRVPIDGAELGSS